MELVLIGILALVLYFLPWIIANHRRHNMQGVIFLVNLLGAWTIFLWLFALLWAFTGNTRYRDERELRRAARQAQIRKTA